MRLLVARQSFAVTGGTLSRLVVFLLALSIGCDHSVTPPVSRERLAWYVAGHAGSGIPTSDSTTAYFSTSEHFIVAVDKATGEVRWTARPNPEGTNVPPLALVRAGDCLLVNDRDAWCLDAATGSVKWRFPSPIGFRSGYRIPAVADGVVFTGSTSGHVFAIDLATGALRWQTQLGTETSVYSPVVRHGTVYVAFNRLPLPPALITGGLAALDAATGAVRWTRDLPITLPQVGSPTQEAVVAGPVIAATTTDGYVYAYDTADGSPAWRGEPASPSAGGPPSVQDHRVLGSNHSRVFVGSTAQGSVTALDAATGAVVWTARVGADSPFTVRVFDTNVWVTTFSGRILSFAAATGAQIDTFDFPMLLGRQEGFSGVATDDALILLGGGSALYAFRR